MTVKSINCDVEARVKFDIYRKIPRDLTEPTTTGAVISVVCISFILFMNIFKTICYSRSELFVDDPGREGRIPVQLNITLPYLPCLYIGIDIQDDNGRHEVGFIHNTEKIQIGDNGCRLEGKFEISKVPGNFHISTHAADTQPETYDMRHIVHSVVFGDDITDVSQILGSFNPLQNREAVQTDGSFTHDYVLKIVPSVYENINGNKKYSYQYTYAHKEYVTYHYSGKLIPALWFRYELQPITIKYTERRQPLYAFITSICAVVGGTFTVAGIIDSSLFSLTELYRKHQLGKLN
uniref:Endoplasmic reticulum-Golgi intermediate compartment protein 1 n=1 Tax=Setaria digitata TaxID=48799 RepID=A0A915Q235_9BILA